MAEQPAPDFAISVRGLNKVYRTRLGQKQALIDVDLEIPRGTLFGLVAQHFRIKSNS